MMKTRTTNTTMTTTRMANMTTRTTRRTNTTMMNTTSTTMTMTTTTTTTTMTTMTTTTTTTTTTMTTTNTTTVTATVVRGNDNGCNSNCRGHRHQSTKIGSKDTVAVATAMETAAAGAATTAAGAPTTALGIGADGIAFATCRLGGLWVLVVTVVCGVMRAGCVCAARPCCFVRGSRAKVHQKFGKPRHIGDHQKACDETSQTIPFN
jgi:hypothetical protein